jgi:hypothetical protein
MKCRRGPHASAIDSQNIDERAAAPIESSARQTTIRLLSGQLADNEFVEFARGGNVARFFVGDVYLKGILDRKDQ